MRASREPKRSRPAQATNWEQKKVTRSGHGVVARKSTALTGRWQGADICGLGGSEVEVHHLRLAGPQFPTQSMATDSMGRRQAPYISSL